MVVRLHSFQSIVVWCGFKKKKVILQYRERPDLFAFDRVALFLFFAFAFFRFFSFFGMKNADTEYERDLLSAFFPRVSPIADTALQVCTWYVRTCMHKAATGDNRSRGVYNNTFSEALLLLLILPSDLISFDDHCYKVKLLILYCCMLQTQ